MQNLKNRLIRIVVGWIVVALAWFSIFFVINLIPSKITMGTINEGILRFQRLAEVNNYTSSFIAVYNNLNRVDVLFKNPNLESRDELVIYIKNSDQNTVYKQSFTGFNFGDTSYARLDFDSISKSEGNRYTVEIVPTKVVDGKLSFGIRDKDVDLMQYYGSKFDIKNSLIKTIDLMQNWVILWPLILVTLFLW